MKKYLIFIAVLFLFTNLWLAKNGPLAGGDTTRYTDGADHMLENIEIRGKSNLYLGYIGFIAALKYINIPKRHLETTIVVVQILLSAVALFCLYKIGLSLFSQNTALIAVFLFAINYNTLRWNSYILAESFFISFLIITCYLCMKASENPKLYTLMLPSLLFTIFLRPNGLFMAPLFLLYIFSLFRMKAATLITLIMLITAVIIVFAPLGKLGQMAKGEGLVWHFENGRIFGGQKPLLNNRLKMPKLKHRSGEALVDLFEYVITYPIDVAELTIKRLKAFFIMTRHDYSLKHNVVGLVFSIILYVCFLIGIGSLLKNQMTNNHIMLLGLIFIQTAIVSLTYVSHDHRYYNYISSFIFLFSAYGADVLIKKLGGISWNKSVAPNR